MSDPELDAMTAIKAALEPLEEATRDRVLRWARDRYSVARSVAPKEVGVSVGGPALPRPQVMTSYTYVADIYASAKPTTDSDKVLVVGYWFHTARAESELDSQAINNELKNLGYPIGNVTRAVTALATSVPRLVIQTKKAGSTQQARKRFKLTVEGMKRVEQMLGGRTSPSAGRSAETGGADGDDE